jgi:hypothetical protein
VRCDNYRADTPIVATPAAAAAAALISTMYVQR